MCNKEYCDADCPLFLEFKGKEIEDININLVEKIHSVKIKTVSSGDGWCGQLPVTTILTPGQSVCPTPELKDELMGD